MQVSTNLPEAWAYILEAEARLEFNQPAAAIEQANSALSSIGATEDHLFPLTHDTLSVDLATAQQFVSTVKELVDSAMTGAHW